MFNEYIDNPAAFKELELDEQLALIADLILYCATAKTDALVTDGKTRVDGSIAAQRWHNQEKYYENLQTNLRRLLELESIKMKRGI